MHQEQIPTDRDDTDDTAGRIAVVGMAGRFPGADSVADLWELLASGTEAISRFSPDELRAAGVPEALLSAPGYVPAKGVLEDIEGFDAQLFGYSPAEAALIDPQQRIFLECAWSALEDAGCDPDRATGPVSVFAGSLLSSYLIHNLLPRTDLQATYGLPMLFQGNQVDQLATRVAYKLNLRGPAVTVQTACSTSLVAVHMAVQSLLSEESDLALAGGVTVTVPHRAGYLPADGGIESADGHCRPFGADANGTVFGNGAGVVVLKRLADALADGDRVHAVILGSAVNNDGAAKAGYTAPGVEGQTAVIREALALSGVAPESVGYVEAHGTGTPIGDPIEVAALTAAYGTDGARARCALGSVKANVGHLDVAAGVTGLIKTILTLRAGRIPASLHATETNSALGLADGPFFVPGELSVWPVQEGPRRAAVSAFGIGGTNAHLVLEQAPAAPRPALATVDRMPVALPLSARTATALDALAARLADDLDAHPERPLAAVARTLRSGRRELGHRRVVVADGTAAAGRALRSGTARDSVRGRADLGPAPVAFLLPGQGAQFAGMALGLYESEPAFRAALDECALLLAPRLGQGLLSLLRDGSPEELRRTSVTQPTVFSVSYALARLLEHRGVRPAALLGHSLGEFTAACLSGVFELRDAVALVAARGLLMEELAPGAMLAVPLDETEALAAAAEYGIDLAALNGPRAAVLSGPAELVAKAAEGLAGRGVRALALPVERAFHSRLCEPAAQRFAAELEGVRLHAPRLPFLSNLTGDWITPDQATDPAYWVRQMLSPVRFHDGVRTLSALDEQLVLVEAGPGSVLTDLVAAGREDARPRLALPMMPSRGRTETSEVPSALLCLGSLWAQGVPVAWGDTGQGVPGAELPGYPFERARHWIEPAGQAPWAGSTAPEPAPAPAKPVGDVGRAAADVFHARVDWQDAGLPADEDPFGGRRYTWLVLLDAEQRAQPVVDLLTARGQIVTCVLPGTEYRRVRRGVYEMDPADPEHHSRLFTDLRGLVRTPTAVLYGWGYGGVGGEDGGEDGAYFGLVQLVRAMSESVLNDVRLGVLTAGAFAVAEGEDVDWRAALLGGAAMVLPEEYRALHCTHVDLPGKAPTAELGAESAAAVIRALLGSQGRTAAVRGDRTLVRVLRDVPLEMSAGRPTLLREHGTYVITGGLGGIGVTLAGYLARACSARTVLLGRRSEDALTPGEAEALARLRGTGAEVHTEQADVVDRASLAAALDRVRKRFGRIDGVVHAAGVAGGGSVERRTDDEMRAVLAPKTAGVRNLLAELRPDEADFLVLCSSLASLVPTYGQADYTAANAALDAFAAAEHLDGTRFTLSVNWDMWAEVGMASTAEVPEDLREFQQSMLAGALTPEQGARAFAALLDGRPGQAVIARAGTGLTAAGALSAPGRRTPADTTAAAAPRPDLTNLYTAPRTGTEERLAEIYCQMLGLEQVGVYDDFLELGGHSLLAAQMVARLRAEFDVQIPARVFFEGGRIADLAVEIEECIIAELESHE
ncbi:type I polyketide synthase [Streptomyces exfoliatus]|uniref:type I polyketide synthase n=1 Tax=Streptomyces exfoliatus TaxID=1905 RepID=UPI000690EDCC|nr:type I polyketide synthase [Streptomyces exfoliatus]